MSSKQPKLTCPNCGCEISKVLMKRHKVLCDAWKDMQENKQC